MGLTWVVGFYFPYKLSTRHIVMIYYLYFDVLKTCILEFIIN